MRLTCRAKPVLTGTVETVVRCAEAYYPAVQCNTADCMTLQSNTVNQTTLPMQHTPSEYLTNATQHIPPPYAKCCANLTRSTTTPLFLSDENGCNIAYDVIAKIALRNKGLVQGAASMILCMQFSKRPVHHC